MVTYPVWSRIYVSPGLNELTSESTPVVMDRLDTDIPKPLNTVAEDGSAPNIGTGRSAPVADKEVLIGRFY